MVQRNYKICVLIKFGTENYVLIRFGTENYVLIRFGTEKLCTYKIS